MTWLTWRQLRAQAVTVFGALVGLAVALAVTGPRLAHLADIAGDDFLNLAGANRADSWTYDVGCVVVLALPAVIGMFWGAPLVARELEAGTHQLVWQQSVTRTRWLATKLALTGLAAMVAAAAAGLAMTWWCGPVDQAVSATHGGAGPLSTARMTPVVFDARGVVAIGYAAFAFALGVTVGAFVRRTVPAMAVTLALFVAVQIAVPLTVRTHLVPPRRDTVTITPSSLEGFRGTGPPSGGGHIDALIVALDHPGAWLLSARTIGADGRVVTNLSSTLAVCLPPPDGRPSPERAEAYRRTCDAEIAKHGYRQRFTYEPAGHYWPLQGAETGLFLTLAAALAGLSLWRIRRLS
ncbi:Transmembrane transport protein [Frankia sp. AiPs1]|uniref:ABC transporter permease subunit n=1 Tax=Frankia sp. AiPa1 TaxID=573492 RepID=UPI00202B862B|nr:ABC transporter permease subunit [Frankia sp. AiPa1]MCL9760977.1 ABC transporter permease subunit [Frankia sp. AiPa1]